MGADLRVNAKEQELQRTHLQRMRSVGSKERTFRILLNI
jgi:hypothetical protein